MNSARVYFYIFCGVICMATSSIIIRFSAAPALIIAMYRVLITSLLAGLIANRAVVYKLRTTNKHDLLLTVVAGVFLALHFAFWIVSLRHTSIPSSVLFTNLQVIFVLFFSIFILREPVSRWITGGIVLALAGSGLIALGDVSAGRLLGDILALLSGFFIAVYFIISRYLRPRVETWPYTSMVSLVAGIVLLAAAAIMGFPFGGYGNKEWLLFFLLALGPGIAGHGVLNWALKYVKAPIVAVSVLGESVGASILAYIFFKEILLSYQLIGAGMILLGIYICMAGESN
ncbi:MAG: DMT family transporter [Syntrophomonadaceae bacterium]